MPYSVLLYSILLYSILLYSKRYDFRKLFELLHTILLDVVTLYFDYKIVFVV
jgi:hypothetical protein